MPLQHDPVSEPRVAPPGVGTLFMTNAVPVPGRQRPTAIWPVEAGARPGGEREVNHLPPRRTARRGWTDRQGYVPAASRGTAPRGSPVKEPVYLGAVPAEPVRVISRHEALLFLLLAAASSPTRYCPSMK